MLKKKLAIRSLRKDWDKPISYFIRVILIFNGFCRWRRFTNHDLIVQIQLNQGERFLTDAFILKHHMMTIFNDKHLFLRCRHP